MCFLITLNGFASGKCKHCTVQICIFIYFFPLCGMKYQVAFNAACVHLSQNLTALKIQAIDLNTNRGSIQELN